MTKNKLVELVKEQNDRFNWSGFGELADFILQAKPEIAREIQCHGFTVGQICELVFNNK